MKFGLRILALALVLATVSGCKCDGKSGDSKKCYPGSDDDCVPAWVVDGGWIAMILMVMIM
jgi:hypothetical protein